MLNASTLLSPSNSSSDLTVSLLQLCVFFSEPIKSKQCCPSVQGCRITHWSMGCFPGAPFNEDFLLYSSLLGVFRVTLQGMFVLFHTMFSTWQEQESSKSLHCESIKVSGQFTIIPVIQKCWILTWCGLILIHHKLNPHFAGFVCIFF